MASVEKRAFRRVSFKAEVQYETVPFLKELSVSKVRSRDISAGGMQLVMFKKLGLETALNLKFFLPGSTECIAGTGLVVWEKKGMAGPLGSARAYNAGIEFISMGQKDRERINQCVLSKLQ